MKYSIQYPVKLVAALIVLMFLFSASSVVALETTRSTTLKTFDELTDHNRKVDTIWVPLYKSHILRLNKPVKRSPSVTLISPTF
ncbi:hypothetical protein [Aliamphritea spongicola]|nr:hypothetical protein [Aliamphritea spongicola]